MLLQRDRFNRCNQRRRKRRGGPESLGHPHFLVEGLEYVWTPHFLRQFKSPNLSQEAIYTPTEKSVLCMTDKIWFLRSWERAARPQIALLTVPVDQQLALFLFWICTINLPNQLYWVNEPLENHKFDFKKHSGYRFGTCIITATGHWAFSPWTTLPDTPIQRFEPHCPLPLLLSSRPLWLQHKLFSVTAPFNFW